MEESASSEIDAFAQQGAENVVASIDPPSSNEAGNIILIEGPGGEQILVPLEAADRLRKLDEEAKRLELLLTGAPPMEEPTKKRGRGRPRSLPNPPDLLKYREDVLRLRQEEFAKLRNLEGVSCVQMKSEIDVKHDDPPRIVVKSEDLGTGNEYRINVNSKSDNLERGNAYTSSFPLDSSSSSLVMSSSSFDGTPGVIIPDAVPLDYTTSESLGDSVINNTEAVRASSYESTYMGNYVQGGSQPVILSMESIHDQSILSIEGSAIQVLDVKNAPTGNC